MTERLALEADELDRLADAIAERLCQPRPLAVDVTGACQMLGVSWDTWAEHIAPEVRIVRKGRRKLVAVAELERWLAENSVGVLERAGSRAVTNGRNTP